MKTSVLSSGVGASRAVLARTPAKPSDVFDAGAVAWAWAGRGLKQDATEKRYGLLTDHTRPAVGDAVVVRVDRIGHHRHIETEGERRLRLYEGDRLVGVFGNRYATDVYEGRVLDVRKLHLLTTSGLIGTVTSRNREVGRPTNVTFLGYLADAQGHRINTKRLRSGGGHGYEHRQDYGDAKDSARDGDSRRSRGWMQADRECLSTRFV